MRKFQSPYGLLPFPHVPLKHQPTSFPSSPSYLSFPPSIIYSKLRGGKCLTYIGTEGKPRISPIVAYDLIQRNVFDLCEVLPLSAEDYSAVTKHLSEEGIAGGVTYDAVILYAAIKGKADRVVTLNEGDFRRIYPEMAEKIVSP